MAGRKLFYAGLSCMPLAMAASPASATLTAQWNQSVSPTSGYILNELQVNSDSDWIVGQVLVDLNTTVSPDGKLLYFSEGVAPAQVSDVYTSPGSATRPFGGDPLDPINSDIPGFSSAVDVASLLDDPPAPGEENYVPATASLTKFDLTWFGPPLQTDDTGTMNLLDVTASSNAQGTWSVFLANDVIEDDLEMSGVIYHGRFFLEMPIVGDYSYNGVVDAADYTVWRDSFNSTTLLDADGNDDGVVDAADYTVWRDNFGAISSNALAGLTSVPEPTSIAVLVIGGLAVGRRRWT